MMNINPIQHAAVISPNRNRNSNGKEENIHSSWVVGGLLCFVTVVFLVAAEFEKGRTAASFFSLSTAWTNNLASIFLAIVLEATPYMVIGSLLSAGIEVFVSADFLPWFARRLGILGIPIIALVSPFFPVCECGVFMVARRLLRKGLPLPHTLTYLLAAPILNPVVLGGTYIAYFRDATFPFWRGVGCMGYPLKPRQSL